MLQEQVNFYKTISLLEVFVELNMSFAYDVQINLIYQMTVQVISPFRK